MISSYTNDCNKRLDRVSKECEGINGPCRQAIRYGDIFLPYTSLCYSFLSSTSKSRHATKKSESSLGPCAESNTSKPLSPHLYSLLLIVKRRSQNEVNVQQGMPQGITITVGLVSKYLVAETRLQCCAALAKFHDRVRLRDQDLHVQFSRHQKTITPCFSGN